MKINIQGTDIEGTSVFEVRKIPCVETTITGERINMLRVIERRYRRRKVFYSRPNGSKYEAFEIFDEDERDYHIRADISES